MHADRCDAVAAALGPSGSVVGIEISASSQEYAWNSETGGRFRKITLYPGKGWQQASALNMARRIVSTCRASGVSDVFLCNYDKPGIFLAGLMLRALGRRVYVMGCSKFDDLTRNVWREAMKRFFFLPYQGAIASGKRSRDYMRFMGIPERRIAAEYNTLSLDRILSMGGGVAAPDGTPFEERHFTIVARFIPKKNIATALEAYSQYRNTAAHPRPLHLCGSGPLENELRQKVEELQLGDSVVFRGFLQTDGIARVLATSLALILPSTEEQFGNVVIEAQAMGLPVILSDNCGARDNLVRSGVNGFVVEPDNPSGMAFFMKVLSDDEDIWRRFSKKALEFGKLGDTAQFASAALKLTGSVA
ncbi:glycosyltransferase [Affinirhizobium pseudoryzae]|uniref:glycosyltransferase n=1 Tax=Allorhizobium pseudoryzae TaxID=379684 RepID=UPI0013ECE075|nr:glycosyltransferase [Allorhizobium pseudoryzae]